MQLDPKKHILIGLIIWIVSLSCSLWWNLTQLEKFSETVYLKKARAFVEQIVVTRAWNALHGGVYLQISDSVQSNPFLQIPGKDIKTSEGMQLTLINPALMTRMISEIAKEQGQVKFHLTSMKPINPGNEPAPWERVALQSFEKSPLEEYHFSRQGDNEELFHFMVPLVTELACLQCHKKQGYQEGDIRGGISVTFPIQRKNTTALIFSHFFILSAGVLLIVGFGRRIVHLTDSLKKQSDIDGLTQIANRKYFDEIFHREWLRCRRTKTALSLIMCDIDHFKLYNDTYGHQVGDSCLKQVVQALNSVVSRPTDLVARYGGEEFVVILPETSSKGALVVAEFLKAAVEKLQIPHKASKTADYVTISLGVATMGSQVISEKELIERADKALYASKDNGRNTLSHADG